MRCPSRLLTLPLCLSLSAAVVGCSGTDNVPIGGGDGGGSTPATGATTTTYDELFDAPASSTVNADDIHGLWGGKRFGDSRVDTRWRLETGRMTLAARCTGRSGESVTVGVSVAARIDTTEIVPLESKSDKKMLAGEGDCQVKVPVESIHVQLIASTLHVMDLEGFAVQLVKLHD